MMLDFFTQKILFIICGVLAGIALVFFLMYRSASNDYHDLQTQVATAQAKADAEAARLRAESERVTRDVSESWSAALDWQRAHPRIVRVRDSGNCAALRPISGTPGQLAQLPVEESGLGARADVAISAAECEERLNHAVEDAAVIEWLKFWVTEQRRVSQ